MDAIYKAPEIVGKTNGWADKILISVSIGLLIFTFFALFFEKKMELRHDLNQATAAIAKDFYRQCAAQKVDKCEHEIQDMTMQLRNSLIQANERYAAEFVPQWASQGLLIGFVGFLIVLLGFKRFESIDSVILQGHEGMRSQIEARLKNVVSDVTGNVLGNIQKDVKSTADEKTKEVTEKIQALSGQLYSDYSQRAVEFNRMQDALLKQFGWLKIDELEGLDPEEWRVQSAQDALEKARQLMASGKKLVASRVLHRIVENRLSGDADDYFNASTLAMTLGNLDLAKEIADVGLSYSPSNADLRVQLARIIGQRGDLENADKIFSTLASDQNLLAQFWRISEFYTDFLVAEGRYTEADALMKTYERLVEGGGRGTIHPLLNHALVQERRCNVSAAKSMLKSILERFPGDTGVAYNLARLLREEGNPREARAYIEQSLLNSAEAQPSVSLGTVLHLRAQIYEALASEEVVEKDKTVFRRIALESYAHILRLGEDAGWHTRKRAKERLVLSGFALGGDDGGAEGGPS